MTACRAWMLLGLLLTNLGLPHVARAQGPAAEEEIVTTAEGVLTEVMSIPGRQIPQSLLANARGVAIIPNVVKGGFVVGIRHGRGVMLIRDNRGAWQAPTFISLTGGSVGWQAGIQSTDLILVFRTERSVNGLMRGKLTIGVDAAAAAGPVGRNAAASTDAALAAEILSYSKSRGLFAGVAIDGSSIQVEQQATAMYYQPRPGVPGAPGVAVNEIPQSAIQLINRLNQYSATPQVEAPALETQPFPEGLPAPAGPTLAPPQNIGAQLIAAQSRLLPLLDPTWRTYLTLPANAEGQLDGDPAVLRQTLQRYDAVATDPRYANLAARPEFAATYQLLKQYVATVAAAGTIQLPPPPESGRRY